MTEGVNKPRRGISKKSEALKVGVDMPVACQLSGNVVPAVGMREGAKPRRIPYLAITCLKLLCRIAKYMISLNAVPKIFILLSKFSPIFSIFVSALVRVSDGALPLLTSPHGNFSRDPA